MQHEWTNEHGAPIEVDTRSQEEKLAAAFMGELTKFLMARADDLPHRFKAPPAFCDHMRHIEKEQGVVTDYYTQFHIGWGASPIIVRTMIVPRKHMLVLEFDSPDGMRLFTLEIEYDNEQ